jgi:hypothetical protein
MAAFLKVKGIKKQFNENGYQITKDGIHALDVKVGEWILSSMKAWNGHHKRINANLINLIK